MVKRLTRKITGRHHVIYCDNLFTSATLFDDLLKDKFYTCGTYNYTKSGFKTRSEYKYMQRGNL